MGDLGGHEYGYQREAWESLGSSCQFLSSFGTLCLAVVIGGYCVCVHIFDTEHVVL